MALAKKAVTVLGTESGRVLENAIVRVMLDGVQQSTYSDASATPLEEVTTNADGFASFWVEEGTYTLEYWYNDVRLAEIEEVEIFDLSTMVKVGDVPSAVDLSSTGGAALVGTSEGSTVEGELAILRPHYADAAALLDSADAWDVGARVNTEDGHQYLVVSADEHLTTAGGIKLQVIPQGGVITSSQFGLVADTTETVDGTDNATRLQAALDTGIPLVIERPPSGFAYGVSQVVLPRAVKIVGPGMYTLAVRGLSTSATITAGATSGELLREVSISDLYVENNRGGDAVNLDWCPDFNLTSVYFRSVANGTLGTSAGRGLNLKNCERGAFLGQCRFGGNPALRLVKDCNAVQGLDVVASGGSAGLAVDISGCQNVRLKLTVETSLQGVRIGDNTGDNATNGGWTSGIDLNGLYMESVGTPIVAGEGFAVNGLNLDNAWLNNAALSDSIPFPPSSEILKIGRVKSLSLKGGRWIGAGTEKALKLLAFVATSGSAPGALETSDIDLSVFESVASLLDHSAMSSVSNKATAAATNRIRTDDYGNGWGVPFEWISPPLTANASYTQSVISGTFAGGGRITKVELIEGDGGSLNGARVQIGSTTAAGEILDKTWGAVNHTYEDQAVTAGLVRPAGDIRFVLTAGAGAGKFRIRIRGVVGTA